MIVEDESETQPIEGRAVRDLTGVLSFVGLPPGRKATVTTTALPAGLTGLNWDTTQFARGVPTVRRSVATVRDK